MNESFKICSIGILFAVLCIFIKNIRSEFLIPTRLAGILILFSFIIILMNPILDFIKSIMGENLPQEHIKIVLKAFSLAYITQISSELCRECGENNIAFGIESAGKVEIIILSLPLINTIIEFSKELIL